MERVRRFLHGSRKRVAVGPQDVFEIELKAVIAVVTALADKRGVHLVLCMGIAEQLMHFVLVEQGDNGNHGNMAFLGRPQDQRIRFAADQPVLIDPVPGRDDDVDFGAVLEKVTLRRAVAGHIKE